MRKPQLPSECSLVIVELAADWPIPALTSRRPACRVIAQFEGELPGDFAQRVQALLEEGTARGLVLQSVVLALNERLDTSARAARNEMALGAARVVTNAVGGGGIMVTASDRNGGRSRRQIATWLTALTQACQSRSVACKLRWSCATGDASTAPAKTRRKPLRSAVSESVRRVA